MLFFSSPAFLRHTTRILFAFLLTCALAATASAEVATEETDIPPEVAQADLKTRLEVGESLPDFSLKPIGSGVEVNKASLLGKPGILVFFAMDNDARRDRSTSMLNHIAEQTSPLGSAVKVFGICSDTGGCPLPATGAAKDLTFLDDGQRIAYALFGVFMMPETLLVSPEGTVLAKLPFSRSFSAEFDLWLKVAQGELTPQQVEEQKLAAQSRTAGRSSEEKEYLHHLQLAKVLTKRRQYPQAAAEFKAASELQPSSAAALTGLGWTQLRMKDWQSAAATFEEALAKKPDDLEAVGGLGLALYRRGETEAALVELTDAAATVKPDPEILAAMAEIYAARGDTTKALEYYAKAVARWSVLLEHCEGQMVAE